MKRGETARPVERQPRTSRRRLAMSDPSDLRDHDPNLHLNAYMSWLCRAPACANLVVSMDTHCQMPNSRENHPSDLASPKPKAGPHLEYNDIRRDLQQGVGDVVERAHERVFYLLDASTSVRTASLPLPRIFKSSFIPLTYALARLA